MTTKKKCAYNFKKKKRQTNPIGIFTVSLVPVAQNCAHIFFSLSTQHSIRIYRRVKTLTPLTITSDLHRRNIIMAILLGICIYEVKILQ